MIRPTDAEKRKFLLAEGWRKCKGVYEKLGHLFNIPCGGYLDPPSLSCWHLTLAYRIAKRRKDARDRARLRKAGFKALRFYDGFVYRKLTGKRDWLTKSEALAELDSTEARG